MDPAEIKRKGVTWCIGGKQYGIDLSDVADFFCFANRTKRQQYGNRKYFLTYLSALTGNLRETNGVQK